MSIGSCLKKIIRSIYCFSRAHLLLDAQNYYVSSFHMTVMKTTMIT